MAVQVGFLLSPERLGLLGAVVVDMQGQHLPAERIEKGRFVAYKRPEHVAYISNLAVAPLARRQGIGEELLRAAEKVRKVGCDPCTKVHDIPSCRQEATNTTLLPARPINSFLKLPCRHGGHAALHSTILASLEGTFCLYLLQVAIEWGCKTICLHCDPLNEAASALYNKYRYEKVSVQVNWLAFAGGPSRLQLMQKSVA